MIDVRNRCCLLDVDKNPAEVKEEHAEPDGEVCNTEYQHQYDDGLENERDP